MDMDDFDEAIYDNDEMAGEIEEEQDGGQYDVKDEAEDAESDLGTLSDDDDIAIPGSGEESTGGSAQSSIPRQEQVQMIHMRRYLDQLDEAVQEKEYNVQKTREKLKQCRNQLELLEHERDQVFSEIQQAEEVENTSAYYRLRAQHERVCQELQNEEELEAKIKLALDQAEYELSQAQVSQGKYQLVEDELQQREQQWQQERTQMALQRHKKEHSLAATAERRHKAQERQHQRALEEQEQRHKHRLDEAVRSKERHSKFLKQTMNKLRQRKSDEEVREKAHIEQRMKTMLALKQDINRNRENLKALQARDKAYAKKDKAVEDKQRQDILSTGGNPAEEMTKQKRLEEFENEKKKFSAGQRERQLEIAERILLEEQRMKKRMQQQPYLFPDPKKEKAKIVKPHRKLKLQTFENYMASMTDLPSPPPLEMERHLKLREPGERGDGSSDEEAYSPYSEQPMDAFIPDSDSEDEGNTNLAKPEFEGLWDQHKPYTVPKDLDLNIKLPGASKMEKEMMQRVLAKHREGIVIKQVAGGKEFKGQPFYSKPDVIHFKDFDVGKTYKKKVTLTNVSYTVNYCKLLGITEHLKDFIEIHFDPPGQMSAGLTCEMLVTFKPMINEDLEGEVNFLSQTGPFAIPIRCTTKKCDLKVDSDLVDFGTTVIGETLKRTITLTNNGALGTKFDFYKITGLKQRDVTTAETSLGRLTSADSVQNVSPDLSEEEEKGKTAADQGGQKKEAKPGEKKEDGEKKEGQEAAEKPSDQEVKEKEEGEPTEGAEGETDADQAEEGEDAKGGNTDEDQDAAGDASSEIPANMEDYASLDGMKVGAVTSGEIGPFSSVKLEVIWQPTIPGQVDAEFVITFTDPLSEKISVQAVANAIDVPVWVERQNIDLKICMFDRLYQDTIIVNNRATTALRLKFEVCKELQNHLELLPKTGYIQAQSKFSAQLKFLPRHSLFEEAGKYFDKETGVLQAPMTIRVADQTRPVNFTVHAVVTTSDLEFDTTNIDFGCCTIHEAVKTTVQLTNNSILPQKFGFVGIPEYVDVQPNDGFGTLLPLETIDLDIIFKPKKAREYGFELTCKSLINREFKIKCQGVGVHPPLELSHQVVHFAATSLNDVSTASLHVINNHTSMNEFTHPVPRIGKGEIAPVGPTSFEFIVPEDAPLTISPSVGTVMPGKKCRVQVRFTPHISDSDIRKEAVRMVTKAMEARAQEEYKAALQREKENQEQNAAAAKGGGGKKGAAAAPAKGKGSAKGAKGKGGDQPTNVSVKGPPPIQPPQEDQIKKDSDEYAAAHGYLLRQFRGKFKSFMIPCYVASGKCANPGELPYSIHNTLYLEVHCPAVKPQLVVISDNGRTTTDFDDVSIGQSVLKTITIQNISDKTIDLKSSILDTAGPFQMVNALRMLPPDASHTMLICFTPHKGQVFQEVLEIQCPTSTLYITLKGKGVSPVVSLSVREGVMDMGAVIAGEYKEESFKIMNTSTLAIHYSIKLDSQSLLRHSKAQALPAFVNRHHTTINLVGTQNYSGQTVFDCVPAEGVITAGGSKEIMVTFAPDHESDFYSDGCRIELFGQEESHVFRLKGEAKPHIMYIDGGDELTPDIESLAVLPVCDEEDDPSSHIKSILVTLHSVAKDLEFTTASRDIQVGCVRTMAVSQKKGKENGEWIFESLTTIANQGFNIEPVKGMLEAGTKRPVTITWTPPPGHDPNKPMEASINVTVVGDIKEQYRIMLRGLVVSE